MSPTREIILKTRNPKVSLLFPKFFNILELLSRSSNAKREDSVNNIPTYFSDTIFERNIELTYADIAMCKVKMKDKKYIRFIFFFIFYFLDI